MGNIPRVMVAYDVATVDDAIKKTGINRDTICSMVLSKNTSYLSNATARGTMNETELKKLCEFLSLDYAKVTNVSQQAVETERQTKDKSLDVLIISLNSIVELEKQNQALLQDILQEMKVENTKTNRLENALGQIASNTLVLRDTMNNTIVGYLRDTKSGVATISGRLKDLIGKFK